MPREKAAQVSGELDPLAGAAAAPKKRGRKSKEETTEVAVAAPTGKAAAKKGRASDSFDDLSVLVAETKEMEDEIRAQTGGSNTWLKMLNSGADEVTEGTARHIKGAKAGDFLAEIDGKSIVLRTPELTVLGGFKVYAEKKPGVIQPGKKEKDMDRTVGFWLPQDADQIPTAPGDNFSRPLRNGNYLQPMHWLFVYIHKHPEIKDALIPFQSRGNSYYDTINKTIKKSSALSPQVRLKFGYVTELNTDYNKTYFYPVAEVVGKNFEIDTTTGKVSLIKDGPDAETVREIITRANEAQKAYKELKMVSKRSEQQLLAVMPGAVQAALPGATARRGLPGSTGTYKDEEALEGTPNF